MTIDRFTFLYLDYRNNFISVHAFAEYYDMKPADALVLIGIARAIDELTPIAPTH